MQTADKISITQTTAAIRTLAQFIGPSQLECVGDYCRSGEESQWYRAKMLELAGVVAAMPQSYATDGQGDDAIVHLHYFTGGCDWYIIEKDAGPEQSQAFGWVNLGDDENAELGYISIEELLAAGAELDFHWTPKTLGEVKEDSHVADDEERSNGPKNPGTCPGYAGPAPEGMDYSDWLALNNID